MVVASRVRDVGYTPRCMYAPHPTGRCLCAVQLIANYPYRRVQVRYSSPSSAVRLGMLAYASALVSNSSHDRAKTSRGATAMIRTKSVHSPIDRHNDGLRILATRGHGRGLRANRYDVWMANLGPSEALMSARRNNRITWGEFSRRYRKELTEGGRQAES